MSLNARKLIDSLDDAQVIAAVHMAEEKKVSDHSAIILVTGRGAHTANPNECSRLLRVRYAELVERTSGSETGENAVQ